jgi:hypothetical protein
MRRIITKLLIFVALVNIVVGIGVLVGHKYTILPLFEWLRSFSGEQLELLVSFAAKCQIAFGLLFLVAAAVIGRRVLGSA